MIQPDNKVKIILGGFLMLFVMSVYAELNLDQQRPEYISDSKWQGLKAVAMEQKIFSGDGFLSGIGFSVAYDASFDRVILGAPETADNGIKSGAVYVFELVANQWQQQAKLIGSNVSEFAQFGHSVALDGDWLVVGAPGWNITFEGSVYVYQLIGGDWTQQSMLFSPDSPVNNFGRSIDLVGERIVVGNENGLNNSNQATGNVYLYDYDPNSLQWLPTKIISTDGVVADYFGFDIDLDASGTRLVVGSPGSSLTGSLYVFDLVNNLWVQSTKLIGSLSVADDEFGSIVSIDGDILSGVGRFLINNEDVYVFEQINGTWQETVILSDELSNSDFGQSIEISGQTIAIGRFSPRGVLFFQKINGVWQLDQTIDTSGNIGISEMVMVGDSILIGNKYNGAVFYEYMPDSGISDVSMADMVGDCSVVSCSWEESVSLTSTETSESDGFGVAIDVSGNRAVIGAYQDDEKGDNAGAAYIFEYTGVSGTTAPDLWRQTKKLTASDGAPGDAFGRSVAIDGDRVVVGALTDDYETGVFPNTDAGSVYVYDFNGVFWQQSEKLTAGESNPDVEDDLFGLSVDVFGDRISVGAPFDDENGFNAGATYVFDLIAGGWVKSHKLMPTNAQAGDGFGYAMSLGDERILIGAYSDDEVAMNSGAAYIYNHVVNPQISLDIWTIEDKLLPIGGSPSDLFGSAVSLDGDNALVGAFFSDNDSFPLIEDTGKAYFFRKNQTNWGLVNAVIPSDGEFDDRFAYSVSMNGSRALIGSWFDDDNGEDSGSVYLVDYDVITDKWVETGKIISEDGAENDFFGVAVALNPSWILIGAHRDDSPENDSGSVYVFADDVIFMNGFETLAGGLR